MKSLFFSAAALFFSGQLIAQGCCSGGSGSPIAGGASQGVLQERQMEVSGSYQFVTSDRFFAGDRDTIPLLDRVTSNYLYGRLAYGVTKKLTMGIESGYYLGRVQYGIGRIDTARSGGFADLILFPRYSVYSNNTEQTKTEVTVGMGLKIPLGSYNDSTVVFRNTRTGKEVYAMSPPTIQATNGSQDFIFYGFFYKGYTEKKFRLFSSFLYIKKGWNPLGQKFGDYASISLFAGQTLFRDFSFTAQLKAELMGKMQYDRNVDMLALYNIDVNSTGARRLFFSPQLNYVFGNFITYALCELPLYQYMNGTQIGAQVLVSAGLSYRFFVKGE